MVGLFRQVLAKKESKQPGFSAMEGSRMTKQKLANWNKLSHDEQTKYLKQHPNSIFQKVGVTRKAEDNGQPENDNGGTGGAAGGNAGESQNGGGGGGSEPPTPDDAGNSAPAGEPEGTPPQSETEPVTVEQEKTVDVPTTVDPAVDNSAAGNGPQPGTGPGAGTGEPEATTEKQKDTNVSDQGAAGPAPETPPLKINPETGLPERAPTAADVREIETHVKELSQPGAMEKGSEPREAAAAVIAESGKAMLTEHLPPEKIADVKSAVNEALGGPKSPIEDDFDFEGDEAPVRQRRGSGERSEGWKTAAKVAGILMIAGLIGGGLFLAHPGLAMMFGMKFMENFESFYRLVKSQIIAGMEQPPRDETDVFVLALAEYCRQGDLPPDTLLQLQKHLEDVRQKVSG